MLFHPYVGSTSSETVEGPHPFAFPSIVRRVKIENGKTAKVEERKKSREKGRKRARLEAIISIFHQSPGPQ